MGEIGPSLWAFVANSLRYHLTPGAPLPDTTCNSPAVPTIRANPLAACLAKLVSIGVQRA